jgi:hypothetical protein
MKIKEKTKANISILVLILEFSSKTDAKNKPTKEISDKKQQNPSIFEDISAKYKINS